MLYAMLFVMSFAFVRCFHDTPLTAGLRLAIIPLALGLLAPFTGSLQDRFGTRTVLVGGMAVSIAGLILLSFALNDATDMIAVMIALAVYGAGLGLFIAPNNSVTMSAAPRERSGQAGGLVNLMRVFGTSLGVASASALLSWGVATRTGIGNRTLNVSETVLLQGINGVLLLLIAFAVDRGRGLAAAHPAARPRHGPMSIAGRM